MDSIKKQIPVLILAILAILFGVLYIDAKNESASKQNFAAALNEDLVKTINKLGQETASISVLYGSIEELKTQSNTKDSAILALLKIVNKNTLSATYLSNTTTSTGAGTTTIIYNTGDTVKKGDSTFHVFPTYTKQWETQWETGSIIANKDSIFHKISICNQYNITQEWKKKNGFFAKKTLEASILNLNPNTTTKEFRTFTVQCDCNRGKWFAYGAGAGVATTILLNNAIKN